MTDAAAKVIMDVKDDAFGKYGLRELTGHSRKVLSVAWNKDGRRLASGSHDKTLRLWTIEPHASIAKPERTDYEFKGDKGSMDAVTCVKWKPDHADVLASTSASKTDTYVRFYDARTNKPTNALALNSGMNLFMSWSPDGNSLVVTCSNNDLVFIDYRKMKKYKQWNYQSGNVNEVTWGPTLQHITMATDDGTVRIVATNKLDTAIWKLQSHLGATNTFSYSPNYKYLASGGQDAIVSLWDTDEMLCYKTCIRPDQPIRCLSFSYDSRWLAYSSEDGMVDVISTDKAELACAMQLRTSHCESLAWNPSHNVLAFAGDEREVPRDGYVANVFIMAPKL